MTFSALFARKSWNLDDLCRVLDLSSLPIGPSSGWQRTRGRDCCHFRPKKKNFMIAAQDGPAERVSTYEIRVSGKMNKWKTKPPKPAPMRRF